MMIESAQFFQPVALKTPGKRSPLVTAVTDRTHDIEREDMVIKVREKGSQHFTHVTLMNTCWYIPLEVPDAPSTSEVDTPRAPKAKIKRNPVAPIKLPTTD